MRVLAIGDMHGCYGALQTLVQFVPLRHDDTVITLGDYVNRGPNSKAVLDWLIDRSATNGLITLRGNHDLMMLRAREEPGAYDQWRASGGDATLAAYAPADRGGRLDDVPAAHWSFLRSTRPWYETKTHFFVHAGAYPDFPLDQQPEYMLYWERFSDPAPHQSGKTMICGHTSQKSGTPKNVGHAICIDTWVYGDGWLTCLDVATGRYWQANESGETRRAWLDD